MDCMKAWYIPAPAPWASTYIHFERSGLVTIADTSPAEVLAVKVNFCAFMARFTLRFPDVSAGLIHK